MSLIYFEVSSAYRNRNEYPQPAQFIVQQSQGSQAQTPQYSTDPVCNAQPTRVWQTFGTLSGVVPDSAVNQGNTFQLLLTGANPTVDYYNGCVINLNDNQDRTRIEQWIPVKTAVFEANTNSESTVINTATGPVTCTITDPTDYSDIYHYQVFIPYGFQAYQFYSNAIIFNDTKNQYMPIAAYDAVTHVAGLTLTGGNISNPSWDTADVLTLRLEPPAQFGYSCTGLSTTNLLLDSSAPFLPAVGDFVRSVSLNESQRIVAATGSDVFVTPGFTSDPSGSYQLLNWTRNNQVNFVLPVGIESRNAVCYDVELLNLELPNQVLVSGGRPVYYPYFYVELSPINRMEGPIYISSNNPNSTKMLFRAVSADTTVFRNSPFIRIDGDGIVQRIKLNPCDAFKFSVYLPNGTLFQTFFTDTVSPAPPDVTLQISALFRFRRVLQQ